MHDCALVPGNSAERERERERERGPDTHTHTEMLRERIYMETLFLSSSSFLHFSRMHTRTRCSAVQIYVPCVIRNPLANPNERINEATTAFDSTLTSFVSSLKYF